MHHILLAPPEWKHLVSCFQKEHWIRVVSGGDVGNKKSGTTLPSFAEIEIYMFLFYKAVRDIGDHVKIADF